MLDKLSSYYETQLADLVDEIHALAVGEILFDEMLLPGGREGPTSIYGTAASVLEQLADQGHPLPERILASASSPSVPTRSGKTPAAARRKISAVLNLNLPFKGTRILWQIV